MRYALAAVMVLAVGSAQFFHGGAWEPVFSLPACLFMGAALVFAAAWQTVRPPPSMRIAAVGALVLFVAMVAWRVLVFPGDHPSFHLLLAGMAAAVYLVTVYGVSSAGARAVFVYGVLALAAAQLLFVLGQTGGREWAHPWFSEQLRVWFEVRYGERWRGFFLNANHFSWFLNFACLFSAALAFWARIPMTLKIVLGVLSMGFAAGSLMTLSRGGALSLIAGIVVLVLVTLAFALIGGRRRRLAVFCAFLVPCAVLVGGVWMWVDSRPEVAERISRAGDDPFRSALWPVALRQIQVNPLVGTGPNSFRYYGRMHRSLNPDFFDSIYTHNDWLQVTGDYGLIGLAAVLLVLGTHAFAGLRGAREALARPRDGPIPQDTGLALTVGAMAVLACFAVHSVTDFNLQVSANAMLAAFALGCLVVPGGPAALRGGRIWERGVGMALCLAVGGLLFFFCVPRGAGNLFVLRGEAALDAEEPAAAVRSARAALQWTPRSSRAYMLAGRSLHERGLRLLDPRARTAFYTSARAAFQQAARFDPRERMVYLHYARLLASWGYFDAAERLVKRVVLLDPLHGFAYIAAGDVYRQSGKPAKAMRYYGVARVLPGNWRTRSARIRELREEMKGR